MCKFTAGKNAVYEMRNLIQWVACLSMLVDHIGVVYDNIFFRVIGRLAMPLFCMSFAITLWEGRFSLFRLLFFAMIAQPFYFFLCGANLNIIFGFAFFGLVHRYYCRRAYLRLFLASMFFLLPVEYGWYLYFTLLVFMCSLNSWFVPLTFVYMIVNHSLLQGVSIMSLYLPRFNLLRMPKMIYRFFYPVHLAGLCWLKLSACVLCLVLVGCQSQTAIQSISHKNLYQELTIVDVEEIDETPKHELYSFVSDGLPLTYFVRWLSDVTGCSVVTSEDIDKKPLTASIKNQSLDTIIEFISRRYNMQVIRTGTMYYIGDLLPEDKGVLVRKVRKLNREGLSSAISNLLSEYGRCTTYDDGLCVVSDKMKVLNKVDAMLTQLEEKELNSWVIQIYLISARQKDFMNVGLDTTLQAEITYNSVTGAASSSKAKLALSSLLEASSGDEALSVIADPLFVIVDGGQTKFYMGESYPVPKKSVSNEGTVQTTGYDYVPVGLTIDVGIREISQNAARLLMDIELSNVIGFVEDVPITDEQKYNMEAVCQMQGVYLLGSMRKQTSKGSGAGPLFNTLFRREKNDSTIQVWAKIYRIKSPVKPDVLRDSLPSESELLSLLD